MPVQSTRMSPGSTIERACSADTSPAMRSTVPVSRASISSLSELLDRLQRDEPARPLEEQGPQVRGDGTAVRHPRLELGRLEDGLDVLPVDHVRLVALERVGHEVRGERHHAGARVLGSALVEADRAAIDRLEQRGQEQANRSGTDDVDSTLGTRGQGHREPS